MSVSVFLAGNQMFPDYGWGDVSRRDEILGKKRGGESE